MDGKLYKYGDISVELQCIELFGKAGAQMLIIDAVKFCMPYKDEIRRIAGVAAEAENEVFKKRAQSILCRMPLNMVFENN